jgi:hypothetical protein
MIFKIFSPKYWQKMSFLRKLDHNIGFKEKTPSFDAGSWPKSQKIVIITLTPVWLKRYFCKTGSLKNFLSDDIKFFNTNQNAKLLSG